MYTLIIHDKDAMIDNPSFPHDLNEKTETVISAANLAEAEELCKAIRFDKVFFCYDIPNKEAIEIIYKEFQLTYKVKVYSLAGIIRHHKPKVEEKMQEPKLHAVFLKETKDNNSKLFLN